MAWSLNAPAAGGAGAAAPGGEPIWNKTPVVLPEGVVEEDAEEEWCPSLRQKIFPAPLTDK